MVQFWPFDGWDVPQYWSTIAEVVPIIMEEIVPTTEATEGRATW